MVETLYGQVISLNITGYFTYRLFKKIALQLLFNFIGMGLAPPLQSEMLFLGFKKP